MASINQTALAIPSWNDAHQRITLNLDAVREELERAGEQRPQS